MEEVSVVSQKFKKQTAVMDVALRHSRTMKMCDGPGVSGPKEAAEKGQFEKNDQRTSLRG
jgi:hypothetical protein